MDTELRERIDHSKFHHGAVREVAALLPPTDEGLGALLTETIAAGDQLGFVMLTTAALHAGHRVGAEHLAAGIGLIGDIYRLGNFAWKVEGDVAGAIMAALKRNPLSRETHAAVLFIVAAWCAERRGGELPPDFAAEARHLARVTDLPPTALAYLSAAALEAKDGGFVTVLRQHHPRWSREQTDGLTEKFAASALVVYASPVMDLVPVSPSKVLAQGRQMRRAVEKLGRNDLCHCGSGLKYKRCCFEKDQERLQFSSDVAGRTQAELRAESESGLTESRLKAMQPFEVERLNPGKIPESLRHSYITLITGVQFLDRMAEFFEVVEWNEERKKEWDFAIFFVMRRQRKDIAERMVAARARHDPVEDLREGVSLLLARDDPAAELRVLTETAAEMLRETDPDELVRLAYGVLCSRHVELGILICRSLVPLLPRKDAGFLLGQILEARDNLNLSPDDPFSDVLEKRLAEETPDEGRDAAELRAARKRLDAKAAEIRDLTEKISRQRLDLNQREKEPRPGTSSAQVAPQPPANDAALREMRLDLNRLKTTLNERSAERIALRRELEKARDELDTLRHENPAPPSAARGAADGEDAHYLPEQPVGNQPLRLVEFPRRFRETLEELPRNAARAALAMIGRLAGGEPAAFSGVVHLKACHGILRQRIGSEHRLLFRLLPDRVQVVDLINRRDLDRTIKTLRAAG